ncbi:hypothetical protein LINGRAHAP2_LOCUS4770 [Linum grandiflorum]
MQRCPLAKRKAEASPLDSSLWHTVWGIPVLPKLRFFHMAYPSPHYSTYPRRHHFKGDGFGPSLSGLSTS